MKISLLCKTRLSSQSWMNLSSRTMQRYHYLRQLSLPHRRSSSRYRKSAPWLLDQALSMHKISTRRGNFPNQSISLPIPPSWCTSRKLIPTRGEADWSPCRIWLISLEWPNAGQKWLQPRKLAFQTTDTVESKRTIYYQSLTRAASNTVSSSQRHQKQRK